MTYLWRKLSAAKWEDVWMDRLAGFADRLAIITLAGSRTLRLQIFGLSKKEAAELSATFGGQVLPEKKPSAEMSTGTTRPPIRVRDQLVVISKESERKQIPPHWKNRPVLIIPCGMAFGTGDHATTATCLRFLADIREEREGQSWELLDLGTGSGILGLAGRILGARKVLAGDFDPAAVRIAKENMEANRLEGVKIQKLDVRSWEPKRKWEVIVANMYSGILIEVAPKIAAAAVSGGHLIFSGILRDQESGVVAAFRKQGFSVQKIVRKGKWVTGLAVAGKTR